LDFEGIVAGLDTELIGKNSEEMVKVDSEKEEPPVPACFWYPRVFCNEAQNLASFGIAASD